MKGNIFHDPTTKLPKDDPRIRRVNFEVSDIGARKSQTGGVAGKSELPIEHIPSKG